MYGGQELAKLKIVCIYQNVFLSLNFHMHISTMSVKYLQGIKKIQWRILEELILQSMHYQPLFNMYNGREMTKF